MIKNIFKIIAFISITSCTETTSSNKKVVNEDSLSVSKVPRVQTSQSQLLENPASLKNVLRLYSDSAHFEQSEFKIYNPDKTVFDVIQSIDGNEPAASKLQGKILAYYPDYYVIHFNAEEISDSFYAVKIGQDIKLIKKGRFMKLLTWPEYIMTFFATTTNENPLREEPCDTAKEVKALDYDNLNFRCIEVLGEWVKVKCNADCEGCPQRNNSIVGWIRWRKNGKIILSQHFDC